MDIVFTKQYDYLDIIAEQLVIAKNAAELRGQISYEEISGETRSTKTEKELDELRRNYVKYINQENHACTVCIVFSAFVVEAYINEISHVYLKRSEWDAVDKLPTPAKWVVVPTLAFPDQRTLSVSENLYQKLKELSSMRDASVHSKPLVVTDGKTSDKLAEYVWRGLEHAKAAAQTCYDALTWIQGLLPDHRCKLPQEYLTGDHQYPERERLFAAAIGGGRQAKR